MRWFKHMTDAHNDEFVRELMHKFGSDGYTLWFVTCELVGKAVKKGGTATLTISPKVISDAMLLPIDRVETMYEFCKKRKKIRFARTKDRWVLKLPKLLEFKDEYTKKGDRKSPDIVRTLSGIRDRVQSTEYRSPLPPSSTLPEDPSLKDVFSEALHKSGSNGKPEEGETPRDDSIARFLNLCRSQKIPTSDGTNRKWIEAMVAKSSMPKVEQILWDQTSVGVPIHEIYDNHFGSRNERRKKDAGDPGYRIDKIIKAE